MRLLTITMIGATALALTVSRADEKKAEKTGDNEKTAQTVPSVNADGKIELSVKGMT